MKKSIILVALLLFTLSGCKEHTVEEPEGVVSKYDFLQHLPMTEEQNMFMWKHLASNDAQYVGFDEDYVITEEDGIFQVYDYSEEYTVQISYPAPSNYHVIGYNSETNSIIYQDSYFGNFQVISNYNLDDEHDSFLEGFTNGNITYRDFYQGMMYNNDAAYIFRENMEIIASFPEERIYPIFQNDYLTLIGYVTYTYKSDDCVVTSRNLDGDVIDTEEIDGRCADKLNNYDGYFIGEVTINQETEGVFLVDSQLHISHVMFDFVLPDGARLNGEIQTNTMNRFNVTQYYLYNSQNYILKIDDQLNTFNIRYADLDNKNLIHFEDDLVILNSDNLLELYDKDMNLRNTLYLPTSLDVLRLYCFDTGPSYIISVGDYYDSLYRSFIVNKETYHSIHQIDEMVFDVLGDTYAYFQDDDVFEVDPLTLEETPLSLNRTSRYLKIDEYYIEIATNTITIYDMDMVQLDEYAIWGIQKGEEMDTILVIDEDNQVFVLKVNELIE